MSESAWCGSLSWIAKKTPSAIRSASSARLLLPCEFLKFILAHVEPKTHSVRDI